MITVYTVCAAVGIVVLMAQVVMTLFGLDGHHDIDTADHVGDHDGFSTWFFGVLSFRSVTAFVAFFGLGGRIALAFDLPGFFAYVSAMAAGLCAMVAVALLMSMLHNLKSDGNVHIQNTLGSIGTVYLTIPGHRSGVGKVTVSVQDRSMTFEAVTDGEEAKTGQRVKVVGIGDPNTLEIALDQGYATKK
jgi:membrane protein implicated in regulation of membrane protease activity